jgi:RNA-directed DNA polymerase
MTAALERTHEWIKQNRHMKLKEMIKELNMKLRGHYNYYGITFNSRGINCYYLEVVRMLQKWLNRRGGKRVWNWERYVQLINKWEPLLKPKIYHSQLLTKPI